MTNRAEVTAALQALAVQQAALVEAQAESVRIQRVLVERLLNESTERVTISPAILPAPADDVARLDVAAPPSPIQLAQSPEPAPTTAPTSRGRASRYFDSHSTRPAKVVTQHELALLRGVVDVGPAGGFVLQFGPHRGATLAQIARTDPSYIRSLATKAQRPNVRAAALRLVSVLEEVDDGARKTRSNRRVRAR